MVDIVLNLEKKNQHVRLLWEKHYHGFNPNYSETSFCRQGILNSDAKDKRYLINHGELRNRKVKKTKPKKNNT